MFLGAVSDSIFGNLNMGPLQQRIRLVLSWLATLGLIIAWVFPVAFVGSLSYVPIFPSNIERER